MRSGAPFVWSFAGLRHASPCALLAIVVGCSHNGSNYPQLLADRILAPPDAVSATSEEGLPKPKAVEDEATEPDETRRTAVPMPRGPDAPTSQALSDSTPGKALTLPDAIALAFRLQPRLRASLESIQQARGRDDIAFAAFLPVLTSAYSYGGFDLTVGGRGCRSPTRLPSPSCPSPAPSPSA